MERAAGTEDSSRTPTSTPSRHRLSLPLTILYSQLASRGAGPYLHTPRLVNQNFLYSQSVTVFNASYFAQTDSNSNYAALNTHLAKTFSRGYLLDFILHLLGKSLDQISNGSGANSLRKPNRSCEQSNRMGAVRFRHTPPVHGERAVEHS